MDREQIPPLELAFRIAELGGYACVEVLSHQLHGVGWELIVSEHALSRYTNPDDYSWHVYDIRRRGNG